ncbi:hypothetical protein [Cellulomonas sp.]|uniref:hypothetical protein n=1 Tax=Cellulomonas sp. TaxID=40001 RepID=UPI001B18C97E|nr:hypothetical protein [Cellulomonas sp.]MBO9555358.1 hypothetical protein [Cellulomonas sp.]
MRRSTATSLCALALVPLLVGTTGGAASAADSGDVTVTNTETVQARLNANGALLKARVYEQLDLSGHGTATITNPVSTHGLRNLDGFGGYQVRDGAVVTSVDVDGEKRLRSVSDYDQELPLQVAVSYLFDGKPVEPGAVVGKTGTLTVRYTVKNVTGKQQAVEYDDGTGGKAKASAETVVPMIGSLTTTLPSSFTEVRSDEAAMAGDGHGGTLMTFQMTLFPPIGSATAEFGYTAHVSKGVIPPATLTSLPVSPLDFPSYKAGSASYQSGANSGVDLTSGAVQIDSNLLLLRDGASELLAGLLQLRDGADQLESGLNDEAAPGAAKLADGSRQLASGLAEANAKAPQLIAGLTLVDGGLSQVDAGLKKMYGQIGTLPTEAQALHDGIARLRAGIGTATAPGPLLAGLQQLQKQVSGDAPAALADLSAAVYANDPTAPGAYQKLTCAITVLGDVLSGAGPAAAGGCYPQGRPPMPALATVSPASAAVVDAVSTQLTAGRNALADPAAIANPNDPAYYLATSTNPTIEQALAYLYGGAAPADPTMQQALAYLQGRLANVAGAGFGKLQCGLTVSLSFCPKVDADGKPTAGLLEGLDAVDAGVSLLVTKVVTSVQSGVGGDSDTQANGTLRGGIHSLQGGVDQLSAGGDALKSGLGQLGAGAVRLDRGAHDLASGLKDAADGSTQLADGLATAADGAPGLVDGAQRLSDEGTSQLVDSGEETAADYGVKYAVLKAGAERASTEGMAYGAPDGALGATAYSIEIAGVDGEGVNATGRGLAAVALFAIGAGIATVVRRRLV